MNKAESIGPQISLAIVAVFFLLGAVVGNLTAMLASDGGELGMYFGGFWENAKTGNLQTAFLNCLLTGLLIPVTVFFLGFSSLGVVLIPVCVAFKGFVFSYSVSSMLMTFGPRGTIIALGAFGLTNIVYIPCMFLTAMFAFRSSAVMASVFFGKHPKPPVVLYGSIYFLQFGICALVVLALSSFQAFVQPMMLTWMTSLLI